MNRTDRCLPQAALCLLLACSISFGSVLFSSASADARTETQAPAGTTAGEDGPDTLDVPNATSRKIVWALTPLPPAMSEKDGKIVGYGVDILDWFADRLPDYSHKVEIIPLPRLIQTFTGPGTICNIGLQQTPERRKILYFSKAVLPHLPVHMIVDARHSDLLTPYLDYEGKVNLERVIARGDMEGALRRKRSYGAFIDAVISRHQNDPHLSLLGKDTHFLQLIAMSRLDWTLYFPDEAEFHRRVQTPDAEFASFEISGNNPLLHASIACSKTEDGKSAVAAIDALVEKHPDMPWVRFYAASLSDRDRIRYEAALKRHFAKPPANPDRSANQ